MQKFKMEIDETINKWFQETEDQISAKIDKNKFRPLDGLCIAVHKAARDYCNAIFCLTGKNHLLPAKALLRCLCELSVKLSWCLIVPDGLSAEEESKVVEQKIKRWEKDTLCEKIKILKKFKEAATTASDSKLEEEINSEMRKMKQEPLFGNNEVKRMPNFFDIIKEMPKIFKAGVYPLLYLQFNNAVHLDVTSLVGFYTGEDKINKDNLIRYCVDHAFHINSVIRMNYDIDVSSLKYECHQIQNSF